MRLLTTVAPHHFPDPDQHTVLQLGIQPLENHEWMQLDSDFSQFLEHKKLIKNRYPDKVYFALPGSEIAQKEFHQELSQHLASPPLTSVKHQQSHTDFQSLWHSSLQVQEDICILEPKGNEYQLTAASVCSPSNWKLEEKIGGNLDFIHQPVPGYEKQLAERVNRLFDRLKPDAPLLRFNWSLQDSNELFWRADLNESLSNEPVWHWRAERQTLVRLPKCRAIIFGIRIYLHDINKLKDKTGFNAQLVAIANRLPNDQIAYKNLQRWRDQIR